ncbi:MAG: LPS-assembly protein LptD [Lentisphaerae bacterium]|nr:LPS-assembly protein LptD [Lentisphaerota bacterium]
MVRRLRVSLVIACWAVSLPLLGVMPPEAPEAALWLLKLEHLTDAPGLLIKLRDAHDEVSTYLQASCAPATRRLLADYREGRAPSPELLTAVLADLNRLICEDYLFDEEIFSEVALSDRSNTLLGKKLVNAEVPKLNRRLLEDSYSNEIEPIWTLPYFFENRDLREPSKLALSLSSGKDGLARYLRGTLKPESREELANYLGEAPPPSAIINLLIATLNQAVLSEDLLYDKDRFAEVKLSKKTKELLEGKPEGEDRLRLNRLLLEEAYPEAIRRHAPLPIDVQADSLEYDREKNLMIGTGHVRVRKDLEYLRSDQAIINLQSLDVLAEGNVTFERGSEIWVGKKLRYNFRTQQGDFGGFDAYLEPFYIKAQSARRIGPDEYLLEKAKLSTCEGDAPAAWFRARKVRIVPGRHIRAQHVVLYVKGVPVMYSPFWNQNIGDRNFITLVPGYNSRMYAFLLTTFNYRLSRKVEATTRVDARARRGVGLGQDILWSASGNAKGRSTERYSIQADDDFWYFGRSAFFKRKVAEEEDPWGGDLITYYAQDAWPDEGKAQTYKIDHERYRLRLYHNQSFDEQNYFLTQLERLSDPMIIEQYFRKEYKNYPEPYNYLVLGHRTDHYTASLKTEKRLNDFYTTVDRLPELALDFQRQRILKTPFYYKGKTALGYLEKSWEANLTNLTNYAAGRLDTAHTIYYPTKQAGFLNVTPRVGWRGTWYSKTKEDYTNVAATVVLDTNNLPMTVTVTNILAMDKEARGRSLPELGMETSFKAFKVWETYPGDTINNLRHIAEPYADWTLIPEPAVTTNDLYQFDEIDTLGRVNEIKLGMRNKIQTQRFGKRQMKKHTVYDLLNADLWVVYRLDPQPGENLFSNINWNVRSIPFDWLDLKIDGAYDQYTNQLQTINTRLTVRPPGAMWDYAIEHRYTKDSSSLLNNEITFSPFINWEYRAYTRYEFETGAMEAWGLTAQRTLECIAYKVGAEFQDDDYTFWVQFWFTEFPKVRMDVGL